MDGLLVRTMGVENLAKLELMAVFRHRLRVRVELWQFAQASAAKAPARRDGQ